MDERTSANEIAEALRHLARAIESTPIQRPRTLQDVADEEDGKPARGIPGLVETAAEFLSERQPWLRVYATSNGRPHEGWEVVLILDGVYPDRATAESVVELTRDRLEGLTDVKLSVKLGPTPVRKRAKS